MDEHKILGSLEWWHVAGSLTLLVTSLLALALKSWSGKMGEFSSHITDSFKEMERTNTSKLNEISEQMEHMRRDIKSHETRIHELTIHLVQRVTWIEARLDKPPGFLSRYESRDK